MQGKLRHTFGYSVTNFLKCAKTFAVTACGLCCVWDQILANLEKALMTGIQQIFLSTPKDVNND